jgi:glycosyltransferase involved in cell wall biosynthesis
MGRRVALVTEVIAPYRIPVFNALDELLDGQLEVFFISESEGRRDWSFERDSLRFEHHVLGGAQFSIPLRGDRQPVYLAPPLLPRLLRGRFDTVVVGGWNHLECYWSLAWSRLRHGRFVLWSETPLLGALPARRVRNRLKRAVVGAADAFAVPGPSAGRYLEALGAQSSSIHVAPNAVDVAFWSERPPSAQPRDPSRPLLLYSGRLARSKGIDVALRAFAASSISKRARFVIAGDGPERLALERAAPRGVEFLGSTDAETLRRLYHEADLLVFPSLYDPWGLVVNEAACAGLASVASNAAGVTRDVIRDGENGLVVRAGDVESLRAAFDRVAGDPALAERLGRKAAALRVTNSPAACALGLRAAIG